jgi:hypothetical protein
MAARSRAWYKPRWTGLLTTVRVFCCLHVPYREAILIMSSWNSASTSTSGHVLANSTVSGMASRGVDLPP